MNTMNLIRQSIKDYNLAQLNALSDKSGVPFRTLYKVARGVTTDAKSSTADAIVASLGYCLVQTK